MRDIKEGGQRTLSALFWGMLATAALQFVVPVIAGGKAVGREKFVHWELDMAENFTGIVLSTTASTLLLRHTIVVYGHQKLGIPLQADNGELSQRHINAFAVIAEAQIAAKAGADTGRNFRELTVAGAALADIHQLHAQYNRIHRLHYSGRQVCLADILLVQAVKGGLRREYLRRPLAAKENHPFVKDAQSANLHWSGGAHKGIGGDSVEIAYVHSVEAPVKADGLHVDVHIQQLGLTSLDADSAVNGALRTLSRIKTQVFNAVFIGRYNALYKEESRPNHGTAFSGTTKYIHIFQSTGPGSRATETGAPPLFDTLVIS